MNIHYVPLTVYADKIIKQSLSSGMTIDKHNLQGQKHHFYELPTTSHGNNYTVFKSGQFIHDKTSKYMYICMSAINVSTGVPGKAGSPYPLAHASR